LFIIGPQLPVCNFFLFPLKFNTSNSFPYMIFLLLLNFVVQETQTSRITRAKGYLYEPMRIWKKSNKIIRNLKIKERNEKYFAEYWRHFTGGILDICLRNCSEKLASGKCLRWGLLFLRGSRVLFLSQTRLPQLQFLHSSNAKRVIWMHFRQRY